MLAGACDPGYIGHAMPDTLKVDNPFTGEIAAEVPLVDLAQVPSLVERSARAQRSWARTRVEERQALCRRFVEAFQADAERIAREITAQMGKPITEAKNEVKTCLDRARHMIDIAPEALAPDVLPEKPGLARKITHEPLGVVLDIAAWNYPLLIAVNVVVPAVLAGNSVLLKHASRTPLCGAHFADAFARAGAPEDLVIAVNASHAVCEAILARPEVGYVSFTGSVRGGHEIYAAAARRFIDAGLELGGKDPAYVAPDADFDVTVANLVDGAFYNAGQSCCGIERIYVHRSLYERFVDAVVALVRQYKLGDPMDPATTQGPLASPSAPEFLRKQVEQAREKGARVLTGGAPTSVDGKGRFFQPTVVADATHDMPLMVEESFGPVVGIAPVADDDEAIALMNDSPYGLTASIWTRDEERAARVGARVETGTFYMNRCDYLDPALAWTGVKNSGKSVSLSRWGFAHLTRRKSWHFRTRTA